MSKKFIQVLIGAAAAGFIIIGVEDLYAILFPPKPTLLSLIKSIPRKYDLDPLLVAAVIGKESNGRVAAIKFEPAQMHRARKISSSVEEQRILASSIGPMQVMGWHSKDLGITWNELFDLETNIHAGCKVLSDCMRKHEKKQKHEQIWMALKCYNGSDDYARSVYGRLADLLIARTL